MTNNLLEYSFLDLLLVTQDTTRRRSVFHPSVTIKQGYLWKRRWDHVKFMSSYTFKKRYFWLKYDTLAYAKKPNDQVGIPRVGKAYPRILLSLVFLS